MTFGEKIQSLRKQQNISQEQLAEKMNVTRQAVSKWETEESMPDTENIVHLSRILNVSTDYLLKDIPIPPPPITDDEKYKHVQCFPQNSPSNADNFMANNVDKDSTEEEDDGSFIVDVGIEDGNRIKLDIGAAIYPVAALIFFFVWSNPVVFVIAWIIDEIFDFIKKGRWHFSFDTVALGVFLVLGFGFGAWRYAWLAFIAAWILDDIVVREPNKKE